MKTKINHLLGAVLSLLVTFGITHRAAAQNERIVFYAPVIATNQSRGGHTASYTTNNQILTMNVDGGDVRQLTTGTENCYFPNWCPEQTHILFHRGTALYVMDANGAGTFAVATARRVGADWSPNGRMVCYVGDSPSPPGPSGLWILSVDLSAKGNKKVGTPVCVSQGDFYGPVWSPDGTRIAFSDQSTGLQPPGPRLRVLDLATGTKTTLDLNHSLLPSWDSTGERLAFVSGADTGGYWQLYIANADFSGVTQVTSYDNSVLWPTWSYDDRQVAFRIGTGQNGDASIYKLTLDTGELTLLRNKADHPDWRP
jgi:Tol biopolymer transport system component